MQFMPDNFCSSNVFKIYPWYVHISYLPFFFFFAVFNSIPLHEQTLHLFFFDGCLDCFHFGITTKKMAATFLT